MEGCDRAVRRCSQDLREGSSSASSVGAEQQPQAGECKPTELHTFDGCVFWKISVCLVTKMVRA